MALTPTDGTGGTQGVGPTGPAGRTSLDVSGLKLPTKAEVGEKLSAFGSSAGDALKGMGKGLKLGGAHTFLFFATMFGSDKGVRQGVKWTGKTRETGEGVAKHRRGQIGLGIQKSWGKAMEGLGKWMAEKARAASMSRRVGLGSKTYNMLDSMERKAQSLQRDGGIYKDNKSEAQETRAFSRLPADTQAALRNVNVINSKISRIAPDLENSDITRVSRLTSNIHEIAKNQPTLAKTLSAELFEIVSRISDHAGFEVQKNELNELEARQDAILERSPRTDDSGATSDTTFDELEAMLDEDFLDSFIDEGSGSGGSTSGVSDGQATTTSSDDEIDKDFDVAKQHVRDLDGMSGSDRSRVLRVIDGIQEAIHRLDDDKKENGPIDSAMLSLLVLRTGSGDELIELISPPDGQLHQMAKEYGVE